MAYKPVPTTQKICVHCNTLYYAKDKRRQYCSSSCNTLAWMARRGLGGHDQEPETKKAAGELEQSVNNILTIAGAVLVVDATKAAFTTVLKPQTTNEDLMEEMKALRLEYARLAGYLAGKAETLRDIRASEQDRNGIATNETAVLGIEAQTAILASQIERGLSSPSR